MTATRPSIWKLKVKVLPFSSSKTSAGETLAALFDSSGIAVAFSACLGNGVGNRARRAVRNPRSSPRRRHLDRVRRAAQSDRKLCGRDPDARRRINGDGQEEQDL